MNMNIYKKLMLSRCEFGKLTLKKSGKNKFAGFEYFELKDFLPAATEILNSYNLCTFINFTNDVATLTLVDADKPSDTIVFTSPIKELTIKGANEIQALGGTQTYLSRYLYIQLLNITESDSFDATSGKPTTTKSEPKETKSAPKDDNVTYINAAQKQGILKLAALKGLYNINTPKDITHIDAFLKLNGFNIKEIKLNELHMVLEILSKYENLEEMTKAN